jgi:hypothetical protein
MTRQEIFDLIWQHFVTQKSNFSISYENEPRYYGANGYKCPIGLLIPEDLYRPAMEGNGIHTILERWPALLNNFIDRGIIDTNDNVSVLFLERLSLAHDLAFINHTSMVFALGMIAGEFNLQCPN